ncbi:MAG: hypothetical protein IJF94_04575 [Eubacterium sp.]|nr:hypothetical protein [Eubacterium sp.]
MKKINVDTISDEKMDKEFQKVIAKEIKMNEKRGVPNTFYDTEKKQNYTVYPNGKKVYHG